MRMYKRVLGNKNRTMNGSTWEKPNHELRSSLPLETKQHCDWQKKAKSFLMSRTISDTSQAVSGLLFRKETNIRQTVMNSRALHPLSLATAIAIKRAFASSCTADMAGRFWSLVRRVPSAFLIIPAQQALPQKKAALIFIMCRLYLIIRLFPFLLCRLPSWRFIGSVLICWECAKFSVKTYFNLYRKS